MPNTTEAQAPSAEQFFQNMDNLLDDYGEDNDHVSNLFTPPRTAIKKLASAFSPGISTSTSPTQTTVSERSKDSTIIYTYPEKDKLWNENDNDEGGGKGSVIRETNPSGMVILAKEAILDPTWLDSDEDEDADADADADAERGNFNNNSLFSTSGSVTASHGLSCGSVGFDDSSRSPSHSRTLSVGSCSSLSVGSCGLGRVSLSDGSNISLSGSEGSCGSSLNNHSRKVILNQIDIIDMGVESVSSSESSQDKLNVLDYLYDLDRRDYDLSDCDDETGANNEVDIIVDEHGDEDSLYLPNHLISLKSPPRLSRHKNDTGDNSDIDGESSFIGNDDDSLLSLASSKDQNSFATEVKPTKAVAAPARVGGSMLTVTSFSAPAIKCITDARESAISPLQTPETVLDHDDRSASSSDGTNLLSNCSPAPPKNLNEDPLGIIGGDVILSILDCPGSRTRKKRSSKKRSKDDLPYDFNWGQHAVAGTLSCMRSLRKESLEVSQVPAPATSSSKAEEIEAASNDANSFSFSKASKNGVQSQRSMISGTITISTGSRSPHRSERLEDMALDALKNDNFQNALPIFHQILRMYKEHSETGSEAENEMHANTTLFNIGLIHLCSAEYKNAMQSFEKFQMKNDCSPKKGKSAKLVSTDIVMGYVHYASGDFEKSLKLWSSALRHLRKSKSNQKHVMAELMNNIGCIHFESSTEAKALKYMKDALSVLRKHNGNCSKMYQHELVKVARIRANIGYIYLRMKNADQAISYLEESLIEQNLCLDPHDPMVIATMEYLAISYVKKGCKYKAIHTYSKMLTAQIVDKGAEHEECAAILTKLNLLQLKGKDKAGTRACLSKTRKSIRDNGACQKERFEKLLKVHKVSGLKPITVRRN